MITSQLATRTQSAFPLSIGTSLAFESLFTGRQPPYDPNREIPEHIDIHNYSFLYINIETMIRNIIGSISKEYFYQCDPKDIKDTLISEIQVIDSILANEGDNVCKAVYYYNKYKDLDKLAIIPHVSIRKPNTKLQLLHDTVTKNTIKWLFKDYIAGNVIEVSSEIIPPSRLKALIMTHIPYDLLSYKHFSTLDLLESHTGKLKHRKLWYTKLYVFGSEDMSYIPFMKRFLVTFGDHVMFSPWPHKARESILNTAKLGKWTFATTEDKVKLDLDVYMKDIYLKQVLLSIR